MRVCVCVCVFVCVRVCVRVHIRLAEKELQRKSLEDSLNVERSNVAGREINMQVRLSAHRASAFVCLGSFLGSVQIVPVKLP